MDNLHIQILPVDTVFVSPNRQRTEIDEEHIRRLAADIEENGLIHALTLDQNTNLVAGQCRLTAIRLLDKPYYYAGRIIPASFAPCAITHHTDEVQLYKIELAENVYRKDLSPMDQALAYSKLHDFLKGKNPDTHTNLDTARELVQLEGGTRKPATVAVDVADSLIISAFENDEDVRAAKTTKEAVKIAKKKMENMLKGALGEGVKKTSKNYQIHHADARMWLQGYESGTFAGIITDPPYGVDADSFGEQTSAEGHEYADTRENATLIAGDILDQGFRITTDNAHLYMFCDIRLWPELAGRARLARWNVFATPLIWHKPNFGHAPIPGYFSRRYECILFAYKGDRKLAKSGSDVFTYPGVKDKVHAAQKPHELLAHLMELSFFPGETILDPCAGSGAIFHAAKLAKMKAVGLELNKKYVDICQDVISSLGE